MTVLGNLWWLALPVTAVSWSLALCRWAARRLDRHRTRSPSRGGEGGTLTR